REPPVCFLGLLSFCLLPKPARIPWGPIPLCLIFFLLCPTWLIREVQKAEEREVPEDSLEECAVTYSNSHVPCDSNQPHRNTKITFDEDKFNSPFIDSSSHDEWADAVHIIPENESDDEEEEEKGSVSPSWELLEVVDPEVLQDSLDRCYSSPSSYLELPDSCQPYRNFFYSLEEQHIGFSLDVDEIEKYQEGEEDQNPPCPRLNSVLVEVEEPGVLQDSLDRCYSTSSTYFELPDSFQHYRSAFYSFEEQHISLSLDMDNRFFTLTVIRLHLVFQMVVIFPH
uniref:Olduvai domain-containing protein n=1 Tax=Macaca fascicularis TaxID=9541 RepID=A0A7N9CEW9_MACFA